MGRPKKYTNEEIKERIKQQRKSYEQKANNDPKLKKQRRDASKRWKERNKEYVSKYAAISTKRYYSKQENRDKRLGKKLLKLYGITIYDYQKMIEQQKNACKICEKEFTGQINVDHSHDTGKVRGLLCSSCNLTLGHLKDDIKRIKNLLLYLKQNI